MNTKWHVAFLLSVLFICSWTVYNTEGAYRKPPFNGSIFGKRSSANHVQDSEDLSNACELAAQLIPVCSSWINKMNELASRR